jgi:hypothetical protein
MALHFYQCNSCCCEKSIFSALSFKFPQSPNNLLHKTNSLSQLLFCFCSTFCSSFSQGPVHIIVNFGGCFLVFWTSFYVFLKQMKAELMQEAKNLYNSYSIKILLWFLYFSVFYWFVTCKFCVRHSFYFLCPPRVPITLWV